jgi:ATP-dependent DNA ligase
MTHAATTIGLEGIMAKSQDSLYELGKTGFGFIVAIVWLIG